jgi:hypothetical protein
VLCPSLPAGRQATAQHCTQLYLCRQNKVVFGKSANSMGPELKRHFIVEDVNVGMMPFRFGDIGGFVYKHHGFYEIFKLKRFSDFFAVFNKFPS